MSACNGANVPVTPKSISFAEPAGYRGYGTSFPLTENPISEGGRWINGGVTGLDWTNVRTTHHKAFGTMPGDAYYPQEYADSTAVLWGKWGPKQTARAKLRVPKPSSQYGVYEEVELRLRTTITAHSITGYEINCSVNTKNQYAQVARWNGPLASFTELNGVGVGCADGDTLEATIAGSSTVTLTVYKNGTQILTATDPNAFTSGSPGIGFFLQGATGLDADYGFRDFSASAK